MQNHRDTTALPEPTVQGGALVNEKPQFEAHPHRALYKPSQITRLDELGDASSGTGDNRISV